MMVAFWAILTGYSNSVDAAVKLKSPYVVDHSHVLNESDVNFIDDVNKTVLSRVRTHPHIYVYITGSLYDASRSQSSYNGGSAKDEEGVNRRENCSKNTIEKYTDGRKLNGLIVRVKAHQKSPEDNTGESIDGQLVDGQLVRHSVRQLRVKAHQKRPEDNTGESINGQPVDGQLVRHSVRELRVKAHQKSPEDNTGENIDGQLVHHSVRELRVKAHQKFTQLNLRENDVLLYCSLIDRQIVYYRGNDLRVVFPANCFDVVYTRGCQHDLNAGNFENGIISTVKNASNHIQENSIRIGARHNYDRIKKLCMYWGITIGIFLVISLVVWQRRRLAEG